MADEENFKTPESQRKSARKYLSDKKKFSIWFTSDEYDSMKEQIEEKGIKVKDVFLAGLKKYKIDI